MDLVTTPNWNSGEWVEAAANLWGFQSLSNGPSPSLENGEEREAISQDQRETFDVTRRSTDTVFTMNTRFPSSSPFSVVLLLSAWMRVAVKDRIISGLIHRLICISSSTFYWEEESQRAKKPLPLLNTFCIFQRPSTSPLDPILGCTNCWLCVH